MTEETQKTTEIVAILESMAKNLKSQKYALTQRQRIELDRIDSEISSVKQTALLLGVSEESL